MGQHIITSKPNVNILSHVLFQFRNRSKFMTSRDRKVGNTEIQGYINKAFPVTLGVQSRFVVVLAYCLSWSSLSLATRSCLIATLISVLSLGISTEYSSPLQILMPGVPLR